MITVKNITYVLAMNPETGPGHVFMRPGEDKEIDGLNVLTIKATDEGLGFLVKTDGLEIFHGGNHALWAAPDFEESFKAEIDKLARPGKPLDVLFLAFTTEGICRA